MVTVTRRARQTLKQIGDNIDDPDHCLRLAYDSMGQFIFTTDRVREGDKIVEHEGDAILLIASELNKDLREATIDCRKDTNKPYLTISIK